ncbi:Bifunctional NAD(P)H-hydrate repair enzyme [Vibrio neptunius]|uniref:NAD(P)H-hydrate dehydratase n=1 Tax=Vibrio neptunius TaxID=170651 RepID=UPI0019CF7AF5|nr:NAD(P)H-hydrate dehydratase [Vibrio neptunius]MBN3572275.1 NAD(P)H-hydrate dehydratase [Vibrio neptunius]QXX08529.1 NAD(P)H-hydrate dehydratase [Vibrio neptunius]
MSVPIPLYSGEQVKSGEATAAKSKSVTMYELMTRAGQSVFEVVRSQYSNCHSLLIVCGGGNNGGDGYVVGKLAIEAGIDVTLWQCVESSRLKGDALQAYLDFISVGGRTELPSLDSVLDYTCILDALLGTGVIGNVRAEAFAIIEMLNQADVPVVSVDIPSGLCSNTGQVLGTCVQAEHTVSFIGLKQGLFTGRARDYTGKVHFAGLGVDDVFKQQNAPSSLLLNSIVDFAPVIARSRSAHKGSHGKAVIIGGNQGLGGAAILSALACQRAGAGLTALLTHPENTQPALVSCPEVMISSWLDSEVSDFRLNQWCDCFAIGPGLGMDVNVTKMFKALSFSTLPKVYDADALNLLAQNENYDAKRIITPHPGEASRLLKCSVEEIESDRFSAAEALYKKYGGVVVLKGAGTLIFDGKETYICNAGNPGMATGGMGDILTGVIVGLLVQGESLVNAAVRGVMIHSLAADRDAEINGERGLCARDLLPHIRHLVNEK